MIHSFTLSQRGRMFEFELEQSGRTFKVLRAKDSAAPHLCLGYSPTKGVDEVLDKSSDALQVFNIATRVRVGDCTLGALEMRAPDIETLKLALARVQVLFWDSESI